MSRRFFLGSDFRRRITTAVVGTPAVLACIYLGFPLWDLLVVIAALWCVLELRRMMCPDDGSALVGMSLIVLACFLCFRLQNYLLLLAAVLIFFAVQAVRAMALVESRREFFLRHFIYASLGGLYIGLPLTLLLGIRYLDRGAQWTALAFANNWITDGFALIGGRLFGRRKLAPHISPGKTVEGALIGLACGFTAGLVLALLVGMPFQLALIANVAVAVLTEAGDLLESLIKRSFSVKDAGSILPGHGGILDRADGMLLAGPALYFILRFFA